MILLAVDTSGKDGSVALARARDGTSASELEIIEQTPLEGGTFSAQLVPQIASLLAKHSLTKNDIGAFAVASGPGSFTGLRVGLAAIKALAEILQKPIAAVSRLEVIARSGETRGRVIAAIDAGRGEVYAGEYNVDATAPLVAERVLSRDELLTEASDAVIFTPDQSIAEAARDRGLEVQLVPHPASHDIARIGWQRIKQGITISSEDLEANYVRRSDAEIFAKTSSHKAR